MVKSYNLKYIYINIVYVSILHSNNQKVRTSNLTSLLQSNTLLSTIFFVQI